MELTIEWQQPTVSEEFRAQIEARVSIAVREAEAFKYERRRLVISFLPDVPTSATLMATIVEARTGRLIGAVESPSDGQPVKLTPLFPYSPEIRLKS